ncbi:energy transducer TonB [Lacibacterium aquatile]|uniref:Energy transducer TonB n=1 Tax=Lacibacterium aquatile TaxID=1168082 RepID=A0ABW5DVK3_9PROT
MTMELYQESRSSRPWLIAGLVVLTIHAGGVAAMLVRFFDPAPMPPPLPAILIDMEPLPLPEIPPEAIPLPEEAPPVDLQPPPPPPEPEPVPEPPKPIEVPIELPPPPEPPPPVIEREVAVPLPPPPPPPKPKPKPAPKPQVRQVVPPPPNPLPPVVDAPPPPPAPPPSAPAAPAAVEAPPPRPTMKSDAEMTWENQMFARLRRFTRRTDYITSRGIRPYIEIKFVIDREGNVLSSQVHVSSGNGDFDRTALGIVRRASPLPAPPPEKLGETVEIIVPVNLSL